MITTEQTVSHPAVTAVQEWYHLVESGSDQPRLAGFGTVGAGRKPLLEGYRRLAPSLRKQISQQQFLERFAGVARVRLVQAHVAGRDSNGLARVLVEEERTLVLRGIPAVAWFQGFVEVVETSSGWRIAGLRNVRPEDIISLALGGHQAWKGDPGEVALNSSKVCRTRSDCSIISVQQPEDTRRPARVVIRYAAEEYQVALARLHSGEWIVLQTTLASAH